MSIARTGLIVAMQEELDLVLAHLQLEQRYECAGMCFYIGTYANCAVVAVISGVGKVNAALCTQVLISELQVQRIINIGVAGGLDPSIQPGDIVIADSLIQHDMDLRPLGLAQGELYRMPISDFKPDPQLLQLAIDSCVPTAGHRFATGRIVTGDQFIADHAQAQYLHTQFRALACEMESASIAQVCYMNQVPFVCIRSISDNANTGAHLDFDQFTPIAVANASALLQAMLPLCDQLPTKAHIKA